MKLLRLILGLALLLVAFAISLIKPEVVPTPKPEPEPPPIVIIDEEVELMNLPIFKKRINEDSVYANIINRAIRPDLTRGESRSTQAHETSHFIHSELRNSRKRTETNNPRAFFLPPDKAFFTREANFNKSEIKKYVPRILQYSRYRVYLEGAPSWEDSPLYIFDEWTAYINGATVAVDDLKKGLPRSNQADTVMGSLEFSVYAVATCMAIADRDPELWADKQFKAFTKLNLERAESIFTEGKPMFPFQKQDELLALLQTSPEASAMRDFINKHFDGAFLGD